MQQSAELKTKLDSAEGDACARADEASRAVRDEAERREKAASQQLGAVANSLSGMPVACCSFV